MAGRRMIAENVCDSERLAKVSAGAERLWFRLLTKTDDNGNFYAKPALVRGHCLAQFDFTIQEVSDWLEELASARGGDGDFGLIAFYESRGERFLHFMGFEKHQTLRKDRAMTVKYPVHPLELNSAKSAMPENDDDFYEEPLTPEQPVVNQSATTGKPKAATLITVARQLPPGREVKVSEDKKSLSETSNTADVPSSSLKAEPKTMVEKQMPNWRNIATRHRNLLGKMVASPKKHQEKYFEFCNNFGEDIVLECFEQWAPSKRQWAQDPQSQPIFDFWKQLPDLAADLLAIKEEENAQQKAIQSEQQNQNKENAAVEQHVAAQKKADGEFMKSSPAPGNEEDPITALLDAGAISVAEATEMRANIGSPA